MLAIGFKHGVILSIKVAAPLPGGSADPLDARKRRDLGCCRGPRCPARRIPPLSGGSSGRKLPPSPAWGKDKFFPRPAWRP
ncbi:hypothetical protein CCC_00672 [Paramagnetospirillum magnetotacticum MS-1]|uniref:Uncharacterized protein n=1 Tax=Paramagnetospirillum magnetotacticum MS-1 TaxID=272627 RepID=A0A0C2UXT9_PARME|nr:hypothetical protein CCC_00672 [Paramagnetospirillum magnetotacticum MS-1]